MSEVRDTPLTNNRLRDYSEINDEQNTLAAFGMVATGNLLLPLGN